MTDKLILNVGSQYLKDLLTEYKLEHIVDLIIGDEDLSFKLIASGQTVKSKNIVFDIGNVCVDFCYKEFFESFGFVEEITKV